MRVKRLLKAGVTSALVCMVKADNAILTDQTKELLARCGCSGPELGSKGPAGRRLGGDIEMAGGVNEGVSPWGLERRLKGINTEERHVRVGHPGCKFALGGRRSLSVLVTWFPDPDMPEGKGTVSVQPDGEADRLTVTAQWVP